MVLETAKEEQGVMEKKRSIKVVLLSGLLFSAAFLPVCLTFFFSRVIDLSQSFEVIAYCGFALIILDRWERLVNWQKYILWAIGIQFLLSFIFSQMQIFIMNKSVSYSYANYSLYWFIFESNTFLSFFENLYLNSLPALSAEPDPFDLWRYF